MMFYMNHSAGKTLINLDGPCIEVIYVSGSSPNTVMRYIHNSEDEALKIFDQIASLFATYQAK